MSISLDLVLLLLYFLFCRKLVEISKKMNLTPLYTNRAYLLGSCTPLARTEHICSGRVQQIWKSQEKKER